MEFEVVFNGSPKEFLHMALVFSSKKLAGQTSDWWQQASKSKVTAIKLIASRVIVTAHTIPKSKTLLSVKFPDDIWLEKRVYWDLLYEEMVRQGWVDSQNLTTFEDEETQNIYELISDAPTMRKYYKDYSAKNAMVILQAIPDAWEEYSKEYSGRWGPGFIAKIAGYTAATVGRYLRAFKKAGIDEIEGKNGEMIKIPSFAK
jgi:hypothetical protein